MRLFRVRCARVADHEGLPLFTVVDYVTDENPGAAEALFKELRPEFAGHRCHVEAEIPGTDLPEWVVGFPLEGGAEAVVVVSAASEDEIPAVLETVDHPMLRILVGDRKYKVKWRIDRTQRGCWA